MWVQSRLPIIPAIPYTARLVDCRDSLCIGSCHFPSKNTLQWIILQHNLAELQKTNSCRCLNNLEVTLKCTWRATVANYLAISRTLTSGSMLYLPLTSCCEVENGSVIAQMFKTCWVICFVILNMCLYCLSSNNGAGVKVVFLDCQSFALVSEVWTLLSLGCSILCATWTISTIELLSYSECDLSCSCGLSFRFFLLSFPLVVHEVLNQHRKECYCQQKHNHGGSFLRCTTRHELFYKYYWRSENNEIRSTQIKNALNVDIQK